MDGAAGGEQANPGLHVAEQEPHVKLRELAVREREAELVVELAKLGLRGTLTGALVGMLFVLLLASPHLFLEKEYPVCGNHITIIVGMICITVVCYGGFVFNRQLQLAFRWMNNEALIDAGKGNNLDSSVKNSAKL